MNVFVVTSHIAYEGDTVEAVFLDEGDARFHADSLRGEADSACVTRWEVGNPEASQVVADFSRKPRTPPAEPVEPIKPMAFPSATVVMYKRYYEGMPAAQYVLACVACGKKLLNPIPAGLTHLVCGGHLDVWMRFDPEKSTFQFGATPAEVGG